MLRTGVVVKFSLIEASECFSPWQGIIRSGQNRSYKSSSLESKVIWFFSSICCDVNSKLDKPIVTLVYSWILGFGREPGSARALTTLEFAYFCTRSLTFDCFLIAITDEGSFWIPNGFGLALEMSSISTCFCKDFYVPDGLAWLAPCYYYSKS